MPLDRPLLTDLRSQARAGFNANLPGADSLLRQSNIGVSADVMAGLLHLAYGRIVWLSQQVIPDTAEAQYLERWGNIFGVTRKAATSAVGTLLFTGIDGTPIPSGTIAQAGAVAPATDGVQYRTTADAVIAGGQAIVAAQAVAGGTAGNATAGVKLTLVAAIPGIVAQATLQTDFTGGADDETDPELLGRLLFEIQKPPAGGNADDYIRWATEVPGVTRAWVLGVAGAVILWFMMDDVRAAQNGIPQGDPSPDYTEDLLAVYSHIDPLRPVTAELIVKAPVATPVDITIGNLRPNTDAVKAAVQAELKDLFLRQGTPGGTVNSDGSAGGIMYVSWIWNAVSTASGEQSHIITAPASDVVMASGEIPILGTVTFA